MKINKKHSDYIITLSLALLGYASAQSKPLYISEFHSSWFWARPKEGFYLVNVGLQNSSDPNFKGSKVFSVGTLNNDKSNDLLTISESQTSFTVNYFDQETLMFTPVGPQTIPECPFILSASIGKEPTPMQNIMLQCQNEPGNSNSFFIVLNQTSKGVFVVNQQDALNQFQILGNSQPFFLDLNGDLKNEMLFNSVNGGIFITTINDKNDLKIENFYQKFVLSSSQDPNCLDPNTMDSLSLPHSSSYLDLDGDCLADIFLTKQHVDSTTGATSYYYEIYVQKLVDGNSKYCMIQQDSIPVNSYGEVPIIDFGDIDRDAMSDMIFYKDELLYTFYNKYEANLASDTDLCKQPLQGAYLKNNKIFTPFENAQSDQVNVTIQNISISDSSALGLQNSSYAVPGRIRLGDIDADGFPEILMSIRYSYGSTNTEYILTTIYKNDVCVSSMCTESATGAFRRYFEPNPADYASLKELYTQQSTSLATFVDIDEDGRLDILIQKKNQQSGLIEILCIYNNYVKDTFFVKAMMVNTPGIYGDFSIGSSYRLVVTDLNDNKFVVIGSQLSQSSYSALQMPYCYIGVGRSNNYVETLTAAFSISGQRSIRVWTPIIPNSQLIIFANSESINNWTLELFINPTSQLALIVIACLVCLFIIGVIIIILHIGEKQDDKREKKPFIYF